MSFSRVNPSNWAVGDKLTSAQMNQLDSDHANALDKTSAGDTLSGQITVASGGQLLLTQPAGVAASAASAIIATVPGAIVSGAIGGFQLAVDPHDYPAFSTPRTRSVATAPIVPAFAAGWTPGGLTKTSLIGPGTNALQAVYLPLVHNGATLVSLTMAIAVASSHSLPPQNMPAIQVTQTNLLTGAQATIGSVAIPTPATGAAWFNSGNAQAFTLGLFFGGTVIDNTANIYTMILTDENGANSAAGNQYFGFVLNYTSISDMRFPT